MKKDKSKKVVLTAASGGSIGLAALIGACGGACGVAGFSIAGLLGSIGLGTLAIYLPYFRIPLLIVAGILGLFVIRQLIQRGSALKACLFSLVLGGGLVFGGIKAYQTPSCTSCSDEVDATEVTRLFSPDSLQVVQKIYRMWPELGRAPKRMEIQKAMSFASMEPINKAFREIIKVQKKFGFKYPFNDGDEIKWLWPLSNLDHGVRIDLEGKKSIFARCAIDSLGVSTMYELPATITVRTPHWKQNLEIKMDGEKIIGGDNLVVSYGDGCDDILFFASSKEFEEYKVKENRPDLKYSSIDRAVKRGIQVFGKLLQDPYVASSKSAGFTLTGDYDTNHSGCQKACGYKGKFQASDIIAQPGSTLGMISKCPVSGAVFKITTETPKVIFKGETLYFCCQGCKTRFELDPSHFVKLKV